MKSASCEHGLRWSPLGTQPVGYNREEAESHSKTSLYVVITSWMHQILWAKYTKVYPTKGAVEMAEIAEMAEMAEMAEAVGNDYPVHIGHKAPSGHLFTAATEMYPSHILISLAYKVKLQRPCR